MLNKIFSAGLLGLSLLITSTAADASETRSPIDYKSVRETTANLESYENTVSIVRTRSKGKILASFHADPQLIDENSIMIFEVKSYAKEGSVNRWRCIAVHDVAECLGKPMKFRYLPNDTHIEMTFRLKPKLAREARYAYAKR